jgi:hypothetical protein
MDLQAEEATVHVSHAMPFVFVYTLHLLILKSHSDPYYCSYLTSCTYLPSVNSLRQIQDHTMWSPQAQTDPDSNRMDSRVTHKITPVYDDYNPYIYDGNDIDDDDDEPLSLGSQHSSITSKARKHKGRGSYSNFPGRLEKMLREVSESHPHLMYWTNDGNGFYIADTKECNCVISKYFARKYNVHVKLSRANQFHTLTQSKSRRSI